MGLKNNTKKNTCTTCTVTAKSTMNMGRSISSPQDKQNYWKIVEFFYPDYNPFANEFSADDISTSVENILLQMSSNFINCCKIALPVEFLSIILSISDAISVRNPAKVVSGMWQLFGQGVPGTTTYEACRNTQALFNKSQLYMAFLGI